MAEDPAAGTFAVRYDYYEVMNGFAADVEYRFLKDIAALDSVDSVYVGDGLYRSGGSGAGLRKCQRACHGGGLTAARIPATAR